MDFQEAQEYMNIYGAWDGKAMADNQKMNFIADTIVDLAGLEAIQANIALSVIKIKAEFPDIVPQGHYVEMQEFAAWKAQYEVL
jgi:hypothetical protein